MFEVRSDLTRLILRLGDSLGFRSVGGTGCWRSRGVLWQNGWMCSGPTNLFLDVERNGGEYCTFSLPEERQSLCGRVLRHVHFVLVHSNLHDNAVDSLWFVGRCSGNFSESFSQKLHECFACSLGT